MRANYRMQRLFVDAPLAPEATVQPTPAQVNYLANVMRLKDGAEILLFNGRDGEWTARLAFEGRKRLGVVAKAQTRPQPERSDLWYCFAPLKQGRLDYMVQKAVEMGAGVLQPVVTQHTQVVRIGSERIAANAVEAAEQCGILSLPECRAPVRLEALLHGWPKDRRLIFCDEDAAGDNPLPILKALPRGSMALLVGPEGGFSEDERRALRGLSFVTAIPLGPRILRADTAAVASLALLQATLGDWQDG